MKAARLHAYGEPEQLVYEDVPDPVAGDGQVLIKVAASSVNPFDIALRRGFLASFMPLAFPAIIGVDVAGTVVKVGPGVTGWKVGDRVFGMTPGYAGAYAELVAAPAAGIAKIPDGVDFPAAAVLPVVGQAAWVAIHEQVKPARGARILINGALGSSGRVAMFAAKAAGATVVAGVRANRKKEAEALGLETLVLDEATARSAAKRFDAAIDAVGAQAALALIPLVKDGGIVAGIAGIADGAPDDGRVGAEVVRGRNEPAMLDKLVAAVKKGDLVIPIAARFPLSQAAEAHRRAESSPGGKIVILP